MMNEALTKNFEKTFKQKVAVIHAAFGEEPRTVAFVEVPKGVTVTEKLELAFTLTNSIDSVSYTHLTLPPILLV